MSDTPKTGTPEEPTERMGDISKARAWFLELRAPFLTASVVPVILGTAVAYGLHGVFILDVFILTVIAGVCLHLGANISNDYFDHDPDGKGSDDVNVEFIRPFTGGSRMIQEGYLSPREVLAGAFVFFAIGGLIGLYLTVTRGFFVIVLGVIGAGSGFFYTAPPFRFVERGIGEIFIGLNFGVLMTLGAYYVQVIEIALEPILSSIPVAILITAVLYINEFPDYNADKTAGKRTMVVKLGRSRAAKGYGVMMVGMYTFVILIIFLGFLSWHAVVALTTIPLGILATRTALRHYDSVPEIVPANVATVMNHLLTGLFLTSTYLAIGLGLATEIIVFVIALCLLISVSAYRKLRPPSTTV